MRLFRNKRLTIKDKFALLLMVTLRKMGYNFYTRSGYDNHRFNGRDIAIFECHEYIPDECKFKIIAIAGGYGGKNLMCNRMLGKI